MSAQTLNPRSTHRLEAASGCPPLARAWGHGHPYLFAAVTCDHRHLQIDRRAGTWQEDPLPLHYTSCSTLFPDLGWQEADRARVALAHKPFHREDGCPCGVR